MTNLFDVDKTLAHAESVERDTRWYPLEGRYFGELSPTPLKVLVTGGGEAWGRAWTEGAQSYAKRLSPSARKAFNKNATNPLTINPDALPPANRRAIEKSGALLRVALLGPELKDPDNLPQEVQDAYGMKKLPPAVRRLYVLGSDGYWRIPLQADPPAEFVATDEQVHRLMANNMFVNQVAEARRLLLEEGEESEESERGNSEGGSAGSDGGET